MRTGLAFNESPVELVNSLERNRTTFLGAKQGGDFLPCLAQAALLPNEVNEGFELAVESPSAPSLSPFPCLCVAHNCRIVA